MKFPDRSQWSQRIVVWTAIFRNGHKGLWSWLQPSVDCCVLIASFQRAPRNPPERPGFSWLKLLLSSAHGTADLEKVNRKSYIRKHLCRSGLSNFSKKIVKQTFGSWN